MRHAGEGTKRVRIHTFLDMNNVGCQCERRGFSVKQPGNTSPTSSESAAIASHPGLPSFSQFLQASYAKDFCLPSAMFTCCLRHHPYLLDSLAIYTTWPNTMAESQDIVPAHSLSFGHATGLPESY